MNNETDNQDNVELQKPNNDSSIRSGSNFKESKENQQSEWKLKIFVFSISASIASIFLIFIMGIVALYKVLENPFELLNQSVIDENLISSLKNIGHQYGLTLIVVLVLIASVIMHLLLMRKYGTSIPLKKFVSAVFLAGFIGAILGVIGVLIAQFAIQIFSSYYALIAAIIVFFVPGILSYSTRLAFKSGDEGLAYSCLGISISTVAIYLSAIFFLLS